VVRRRIRWLLNAFTVILIVLVSFELCSIAFYGITHHKFFYEFLYAKKNAEQSMIAPQFQVAEAVFHPYLAFINRPGRAGTTYGTNNHGWPIAKAMIDADPLCCDYPIRHRPDEVVVGIFGGSVGAGFALTAQSSTSFVRRLEEIPRFAGKRIRILNFAMSGYHQPQQMLTLAYYLSLGQEFDVVINLDGFNEVVTSSKNWDSGVEPTYPADSVWGEMGRQVERSNVPLVTGKHLLVAYHERAEADSRRWAEECRIASCYTYHRIQGVYHQYRRQTLAHSIRDKVNNVTLFPTIYRNTFGADIDIYRYTADRWADSSLAMAKLMQGRTAIHLHVLQPNQWYRKSGEYKPIERDHIYKWVIEPVNRGYAALIDRIPRLKAAGVNVLDATMIFKDINKGIYVDDCCHYTDAGYDILFNIVAQEIRRLIDGRVASTSGVVRASKAKAQETDADDEHSRLKTNDRSRPNRPAVRIAVARMAGSL
jgi:hypothetical protein